MRSKVHGKWRSKSTKKSTPEEVGIFAREQYTELGRQDDYVALKAYAVKQERWEIDHGGKSHAHGVAMYQVGAEKLGGLF